MLTCLNRRRYHPEYDVGYYAKLIAAREERMTGMGFFRGPEDFNSYVDDLLALHDDNDRKDLAWRYGIDEDLLDVDIRQAEARNWLRHLAAV